MASCTRACSSRTFSISSGDNSSPNRALISSNRVRSARVARNALLDIAKDGLRGIERRLLRQEPDAIAGRQRRLALNVVVEAGHDLQQRGLARSVRAEHADLRAVQKREVDVFENDGVGRINLPEPFHGVNE